MTSDPSPEVGKQLQAPGYVFVLPWDLRHTESEPSRSQSPREMLLAGEIER